MREREREREQHPFICLLACNPCLLIGTLNNNDKKEWKLIKIVEVAKFPNWHKSITIPNRTIKTKWEICREREIYSNLSKNDKIMKEINKQI